MNPPFFFDWMRPVGWALLHFLWQGTVVALLLAAVLGMLKRARPQSREMAATAALLVMTACPVFTAFYYRSGRAYSVADAPGLDLRAQPLPSNPRTAFARELPEEDFGGEAAQPFGKDPAKESASTASTPLAAFSRAGLTRQIVRLIPWSVWAWLGGVTLLSLWRLGGWIQIGRWMRYGVSPVPPRWSVALNDLVRQTGLRRPVRLIASLKVAVPVTAGWLRPVILFPAALLSGLPPRHVEALLAHELAHIRRMDYVVNLAQTVLETLLFYHPAVWWTGRIIRQEREHCCDDAAAALHGDTAEYARALAGLVGMQAPVLLPAAKGGSLLLRLRRLLAPQSMSGPAVRIPASMAAAGAALSLAFLLVSPPPGVARTKSGLTPQKPAVPEAASEINERVIDSKEPEKSSQAEPAPASATVSARGRILDRNGVVLAKNDETGARTYPWGALAAHAVGWYLDTDRMSGTEAKFEKKLFGGEDISLTLDVRLQLIAEQSMEEAGVGRGAVVVLDPHNGDILAMASMPNFDPRIITGGKGAGQVQRYVEDQTGPLVNRAIRAEIPGSTYKIVTAIAACRAGQENRQYNCAGFIDYGRPIACWIYAKNHGGHGVLDLPAALKCSCNCWFFQAGNAAGIDRMAETARLLGMDAAFPDIDGSRPVVVPDKKWSETERGSKWTDSETAYCSIGTGYVRETPVHMASLAATVATRGDAWRPRLSTGTPIVSAQHVIDGKQMDIIRDGMRRVVNNARGTGGNARSNQFTIAGKTGTAQSKRSENGRLVEDNRAWFIGFAPFEKPKFAICVLVENGEAGGKVSAPIAKAILEQAMTLKDGQSAPAPQPRAPVQGHFRPLGKTPN
ncbi:MAG TPA: penicillin-binding transpeptidase domain-containing protein [Verrucomicrobiales bacterium]|nr:penicillin-binding transpeptidase domain-containing protein [Verrucomicrobiales bacterium]